MTDLTLTRQFRASPERVYDAWAVPELWGRWIGPVGVVCRIDRCEPVVGGSYLLSMQLPDGREMRITGTYTAMDRAQHLAFTWTNVDGTSPLSTVDLTFAATADGGTRMVLTHANLPEEAITSVEAGWSSALTKLTAFLENDE